MSFSLSQPQYEFIHEAINEAITCGDTSIKAPELKEWLAKLQPDPETGQNAMDAQFAVSTLYKCMECTAVSPLFPPPLTIPFVSSALCRV